MAFTETDQLAAQLARTIRSDAHPVLVEYLVDDDVLRERVRGWGLRVETTPHATKIILPDVAAEWVLTPTAEHSTLIRLHGVTGAATATLVAAAVLAAARR